MFLAPATTVGAPIGAIESQPSRAKSWRIFAATIIPPCRLCLRRLFRFLAARGDAIQLKNSTRQILLLKNNGLHVLIQAHDPPKPTWQSSTELMPITLLGAKVKAFLMFAAIALLGGCASSQKSANLDLPFHSFERQVYVAHSSIPYLTLSEWEEIKRQFLPQTVTEFNFHYAIREKEDLVRVDLVKRGAKFGITGRSLFFERKAGHWVEDKARARETVVLAPFDS